MKDGTGTRERAEFRSRGEGGEGGSETKRVDIEIKETERHNKWGDAVRDGQTNGHTWREKVQLS